jgi:hypothetical protein
VLQRLHTGMQGRSFGDHSPDANRMGPPVSDHHYGLASVLYSNHYPHVMQASNEIEAGGRI